VTSIQQTLFQVLRGTSDANIRFNDLRKLLEGLGFTERIKGSHHIFAQAGIADIVNLQPDGSKAKSYQVKQVRKLINEYRLAGKLHEED
jgi:predicted RNA binding protein YcfA (HicA-like mRNA interferase family)